MAWKGLSYFRSGTKFRYLEPQMSAVPPHMHCIKNFSSVRYKKTYVFFIIVHFLGFGLAVIISWNQWSPVKQCMHATVKFTNMKEMTSGWNLAPSTHFCCPIQLPEKCNHTACRSKTTFLFTKQCDAGNAAGRPRGSICCPGGKMHPCN